VKVLILNYARQLFEDENEAIGEEHARMRTYGQFLDELIILVHTFKHSSFQQIKISNNITVIPSNGAGKISSFYHLLKIGSTLCSERFIDIINAQEPYFMGVIGVYLKKKYGCKLITAVLGSNVYDQHWLSESKLNHLKSAVGRFVLKYSDYIQVDGSLTERELIDKGIPKDKIFKKPIVPRNVGEPVFLNSEIIRKRLLCDRFEKILISVGRIEKQKNIEGLIRIMPGMISCYPKVLLLIIGEGREKAKLEELSRSLGISNNIIFCGRIPHKYIFDYYAASDIFVLPSKYEGFSRSLMEAGISGRAIVTTNVSGASDLVTDGESGFIVGVEDMNAFQEKIIQLLLDEQKARLFGMRIKENVRKLPTYDEMVSQQINFWRFVCGS
jgi:glycosyltransferase involved in cell wall biosynthesis